MRTRDRKVVRKTADALRVREPGDDRDPSEPALPLLRNQDDSDRPDNAYRYPRIVLLRRLGVRVYRRNSAVLIEGGTARGSHFKRRYLALVKHLAAMRGKDMAWVDEELAKIGRWRPFLEPRRPS